MRRFFETLYSSLAPGARAVLQIYPENADQAQNLTIAAMKAGFSGGLVVDFPHSTRAKKYFLVLMVGGSGVLPAAKGSDGEQSDEDAEGTIRVAGRKQSHKKRRLGSGAGVSDSFLIMLSCLCLVDAVGRDLKLCQHYLVGRECTVESMLCDDLTKASSLINIAFYLQFSVRHPDSKGKEWILKKKEQARHRGHLNVPRDTKYTGRKRKSRF
jgi:hypothetical protein